MWPEGGNTACEDLGKTVWGGGMVGHLKGERTGSRSRTEALGMAG